MKLFNILQRNVGRAIALLFLIAIAGYVFSKKSVPSVRYVTEAAEARNIQSALFLSGQFVYEKQARLSPELVGRVEKIFVKEGDIVEKDQALLQLDDATLAAQIEQLRAGVGRAKLEMNRYAVQASTSKNAYERKRALREMNMVSVQDLEQAKTALDSDQLLLKSAEFAAKQAESALEQQLRIQHKSLIRAPLAGVILSLPIKVGETAISGVQSIAGSELMVIADPTSLIVQANVPESMISRISLGQKVSITSRFAAANKFDGVVAKISKSLSTPASGRGAEQGNTNSGSVPVQIKFKQEDAPKGLLAGMNCDIAFQEGSGAAVVAVPISALRYDENKANDGYTKGGVRAYSVYVVNNGKAEKRSVKLGLSDENWQEITDGLKLEELVVTGPQEALAKLKGGESILEPGKKGTQNP